MKVSFQNYKRMHNFLRSDIQEELETVLSLDSDEQLFSYQYKNEKIIAKKLGNAYGLGFNCGTAALQFSLTALGVGKGDEVITVPNTYVGTIHGILDSGATPVFVDIKSDTMLMDTDKIEDAITGRTQAIMPVHLFGQMTDMETICKIAKKHKIYVIEDACQSHYARFNNELPGKRSTTACYSFFPNKGFGGISNGGMTTTHKRSMCKKFEHLRNATSKHPLLLESNRTPAFLDWIQIAFIKCKMKYYHEWVQKRRRIAHQYLKNLKNLPLTLPYTDPKAHHVFRSFTIRTRKRDKLKRYLVRKKIESYILYPEPMHLLNPLKCLGYKKGDFPQSEDACSTVLSLPVNPFLTDSEIDYVIKMLRNFRW